MLELTAAYTSEREQFDRPIGSFQAVSHRAANMFIDHQELDLNLQQASYLYSSGSDLENQILNLKYITGNVLHRTSYAAQHLHGGMGVAKEYPLWRYCLSAKSMKLLMEIARVHWKHFQKI